MIPPAMELDRELQSHGRMSRPVLRSAAQSRGFGLGSSPGAAYPAVARTSAAIEQIIAPMRKQPAVLETSHGQRIELAFAVGPRVTGSPIAFDVRDDSAVSTFDVGTISFNAHGRRHSFVANFTRGRDGKVYATFPTQIV